MEPYFLNSPSTYTKNYGINIKLKKKNLFKKVKCKNFSKSATYSYLNNYFTIFLTNETKIKFYLKKIN